MEKRKRYEVGAFVIPVDLPRLFVCYVTNAHPIGEDDDQLLELQPLDGPWPIGTLLIRMDHMVRAASPVEVGLARPPSRPREHLRRGRPSSVDLYLGMGVDDPSDGRLRSGLMCSRPHGCGRSIAHRRLPGARPRVRRANPVSP